MALPEIIEEGALVSGVTSAITGTTNTEVIAAQGSGVRIYVTHVLVTNSHASVGTVVHIKSADDIIYTGFAAPGGGGFAISFGDKVPLRSGVNEAINAACVTTGSNTFVSVNGFKLAR